MAVWFIIAVPASRSSRGAIKTANRGMESVSVWIQCGSTSRDEPSRRWIWTGVRGALAAQDRSAGRLKRVHFTANWLCHCWTRDKVLSACQMRVSILEILSKSYHFRLTFPCEVARIPPMTLEWTLPEKCRKQRRSRKTFGKGRSLVTASHLPALQKVSGNCGLATKAPDTNFTVTHPGARRGQGSSPQPPANNCFEGQFGRAKAPDCLSKTRSL
jgi:hypothetical protein